MLAAKIEQIRDMMFPGIRAWMGKGVPVKSLDDFFIRDGDLVLRVWGGAEHIIASAEEIEDGSYADLFNPRMKALIPQVPVSVSVIDVDIENRKVVFSLGNHWEERRTLAEHLAKLASQAAEEIERRGGLRPREAT